MRKRRLDIYQILLFALIVSIWAFNETKILTYPIKIVYMLALGYYSITHRRTNAKYQLWAVLMCGISFAAMLVGKDRSVSLPTFVNLLQVFVIGYVTYGYLDEEQKIQDMLDYFVIGGLVLAARLVITTPLSVWLSFERLGEAIGYNSNDVGNKAAIAGIVALALFKGRPKNKRVYYFISLGAMVIIVLFTGSRKALLAMVLALALLFTAGLRNKKNLVYAAIALIGILAVGYFVIMGNVTLYQTIGRRIESMLAVLFEGASEASSMDLREKYAALAWEAFKSSPLIGVGLNHFKVVSGIGVHCHCDYLEVLCSLGIFGAIAYYAPFAGLLAACFIMRKKKINEYMQMVILLVLLFSFITMVMYVSAYVQLLLAGAMSYYHIRRKELFKQHVKAIEQEEQS